MKLIELCKSCVILRFCCAWDVTLPMTGPSMSSLQHPTAQGWWETVLSPDKNGSLEQILLCLHQKVFRVLQSKCDEISEEFSNRPRRVCLWIALCFFKVVFLMLKASWFLGPQHVPFVQVPFEGLTMIHLDAHPDLSASTTMAAQLIMEEPHQVAWLSALHMLGSLTLVRESDSLRKMAPFPKLFFFS